VRQPFRTDFPIQHWSIGFWFLRTVVFLRKARISTFCGKTVNMPVCSNFKQIDINEEINKEKKWYIEMTLIFGIDKVFISKDRVGEPVKNYGIKDVTIGK
jgi:hypothetical protein